MLGSVRRYISRCEAKMSTRNVARSLRTWLARGANTEVAAHRRRLPRTTRPCEPCHVHLTLDSNTERAIKALQGRCARRFVVGDAPRLRRGSIGLRPRAHPRLPRIRSHRQSAFATPSPSRGLRGLSCIATPAPFYPVHTEATGASACTRPATGCLDA